jgi:hypothetical protein
MNATDLVVPSADAEGLAGNTVYYWRVNARNLAGLGEWSRTRRFKTGPTTAPAPPDLVQPADRASDLAVHTRFAWKASANADSYALQVSQDSLFSKPFVNATNLPDSSAEIEGLAENTSYYWRVCARNRAGQGEWSGIWRFQTAPRSAVDGRGTDPAESFSLGPNYPNPFNASTRFRITLPKAGRVVVSVFNQRGEKVLTLMDAHRGAGEYEIRWNAEGFASGVYFIRMESNGFTAAGKAIFLK